MQVSVESSEGLERRMTVELPAEKVNEAVEKRLKEIARTVRLDGFRPGKVPLSVVRKRFANDAKQEVFGDLVQSSYFEALMQEKLNPAGEPSIEPLDKGADTGMAYVAVFEVMPEVVLNSLSDATIKRPVAEVTDEDMAEMVEKLRKQRTTWNEVDREAQDGDQITINFKGFIDGEAFDGGSAEGVPLELGSKGMIAGFEEGLVGAKAGESRTLELTFPESYHAESLAGKPATFEVEVTKVSEAALPEVNDEFIKAFGINTEEGVDGFYKEIRGNMARELQDKIRGLVKEQAMDVLLEVNPLEVPKALVQREARVLMEQTKNNLAQGGQGSNINLPVELFEDQAKKRVSLGLIIAEVLSTNNIELDEGRVREKIEQFAQSYEDPQQVIDYYYNNREQLAGIQNLVLEEQVVDWVLDQVKVEDSETGFNAVMNPAPKEAEAADE
ncbi:trigger factor [Sedimenticola selenatireducens]|uniref:Trigger factor n=1 Tax=Sedimenticola selenatireducens TaxID=191960 RepID=A0A558DK36_9GAMM|nr:trigger factor [Sedimenticola selenatireducens]TVO76250.1 trigger factor [Sedimenticola selenatireducens]TVT61360.1 MAG: trigger factor [Sedimenticola selenatireducens]